MAVSDTLSAGGPLLGPEVTDHAIQLEPGRPPPTPGIAAPPQGIWVAWESDGPVCAGGCGPRRVEPAPDPAGMGELGR